MCRSWDTARLVATGALVTPHTYQVYTASQESIDKFKAEIAAELGASSGFNILLVNHSNIAPQYGAELPNDKSHAPSGAVFVIDPLDWAQVARIDVVIDLSKQAINAE